MTKRDEDNPLSSEGPEQLIRYAFSDLVKALELGGPRFAPYVNKAMNFKTEVLDAELDDSHKKGGPDGSTS